MVSVLCTLDVLDLTQLFALHLKFALWCLNILQMEFLIKEPFKRVPLISQFFRFHLSLIGGYALGI